MPLQPACRGSSTVTCSTISVCSLQLQASSTWHPPPHTKPIVCTRTPFKSSLSHSCNVWSTTRHLSQSKPWHPRRAAASSTSAVHRGLVTSSSAIHAAKNATTSSAGLEVGGFVCTGRFRSCKRVRCSRRRLLETCAAPPDSPLSSREDTLVTDREPTSSTSSNPSSSRDSIDFTTADSALLSETSRAAVTDVTASTNLTSSSTSSVDHSGPQSAEGSSLLASALDDPRLPSPIGKGNGRRSVASMDDEESMGMSDVEESELGLGPVFQWFTNSEDLLTLAYAVLTGTVVAGSVFVFDCSIQFIHDLPDIFAQDLHLGGGRATGLVAFGTAIPFRCVMPIGAGFVVAALQSVGFSPALRFLTRAIEGVVDDKQKAAFPTSYWQVFRKATASVITLGSGASLGPEAPSVELGANTAAVLAPKTLARRKQRMLVAAGAAAGVSAAFDAPVAGALFAVEFVLKSSRLGLDRLSTSTVFVSTSVAAGVVGFLRTQGQELGITGAAAHLVGRIPYFTVQPDMLLDLLQFGALGLGAAVAATLLYEGTRVSELLLRPLPRYISAPLAGALCGIIAFKFPQVQYGYINLEEIFRGSADISTWSLASLLGAKIVATSVCAGGGLIGGLFAPSLFMGALVGDIFGQTFAQSWGLTDPTTLVVVGAAAVLGAACRAPLTAVALMVEITRDTGLLVPLLAAIGTASVLTEYLEGIFTKQINESMLDLYIKEKALLLSAGISQEPQPPPPSTVGDLSTKTVESLMCTSASLYVRHTLPIEQAKQALEAKQSQAAVIVDDNFNPMGLVYLEDIEAELVKQQLLNQPDSNFDRQA